MSERLTASLRAAWRAETDDPLRMLLPAAGLIALDLGVVLMLRAAWADGTTPWLFAAAAGVLMVWVLRAPLRAVILHLGARRAGLDSRGRWLPLVGVQIAIGLARLGVAGVLAVPGVLAGLFLVTRGWYSVGTALVALAVAAATVAAFAIRWAAAFAPAEAVVNGRGALPAALASWRRVRSQPAQTAAILLLGDAATILGGLACGAGSIPGYPIADLALVRRLEAR